MFNSHTLPPPSTFASEHRPLRLTSSKTPPSPSGECCFILLHPSIENQRCSCQRFDHNRAVPGSVCQCGHQSCFHRSPLLDFGPTAAPTALISHKSLAERMQRLEDTLRQERAIQEAALADERRSRERDIQILREALHPFYKTEEEMKRRLIEIEDRVEGNYDEQCRLSDRLVALDDANMLLERRLEEAQGLNSKRRRISRQLANGHSDGRPDHERSSTHSSPPGQPGPLRNGSKDATVERDEPRSSGVLDLFNMPERHAPPLPTRVPSPREEARSSGFLEISLAERLASKFATSPRREPGPTADSASPLAISRMTHNEDSLLDGGPSHPTWLTAATNKIAEVVVTEISSSEGSPKKRKRDGELGPLEILANISAASSIL